MQIQFQRNGANCKWNMAERNDPGHVVLPGDGICFWRPFRTYLCAAGRLTITKKDTYVAKGVDPHQEGIIAEKELL